MANYCCSRYYVSTATVENNAGTPLNIRMEYSEDFKDFSDASNAYKASYSLSQLKPEGRRFGFVSISANPSRDEDSLVVKNNVVVLDALSFLQASLCYLERDMAK